MKCTTKQSVYDQIAYDVASKIAVGEIKENERFSGRSLMGSHYGVSPETIRRSMRLLADEGILEVKDNSGSVVISRTKAVEFVSRSQNVRNLVALKAKLETLVANRDELNVKINAAMAEIMDMEERFQDSNRFKPIEFVIEKGCLAENKTIGTLAFRQKTGATIIAIRHGGAILLSPGPEYLLETADVIIVACKVEDIAKILPLVGKG